jgi:hypothetical protein
MAVKIPIVTVFDSKGLRQAQFQLNKVSGNISNLSRNFAIAGTAFAGIAVGLGKSVKVASDLGESVNALNVAFGNSAGAIIEFGKTASTTLGVSAVDFNNAAVRFSAFADRIVGSGGDASGFIAEISTRAADFASVFNIDVSEALRVFQSGLAGEAEPLKRFGINLLDSEVKAFAMANGIGEVGRQLTETEKVQARYGLLMEATAKTQGDFANTSDGLANGMRILQAQITNTQAEIGNALLPVLEDLLPVVSDLVAEFGDKLKVAVANVDWASFITSIVESITFLVENIETITKVTTALFLLNTAFNTTKVAVGLFNAATVILGNTFTITAGKIGLATGAVKLFRTALITTGIGALVVGLGFVIQAIIDTNSAATNGRPQVGGYGEAIRKSGADAEWAAGKYGIAARAAQGLANAAASIPKPGRTSVMDDYAYNVRTGQPVPTAAIIPPIVEPEILESSATGKPGVTGLKAYIQNVKREAQIAAKELELRAAGLSPAVAAALIGTTTPLKTANEALDRISKNSQQAIDNLTSRYNESAAGQQAAAEAIATSTAQAAAGLEAWTKNAKEQAAIAALEIKLIGAGLSEAVAASLLATTNALQTGQEALDAIAAHGASAIATMTENFNNSTAGRQLATQENNKLLAEAAAAAAAEAERQREAARAAAEAARAEAAALAERQRVFKSFQDSVKNTFTSIRDSILQGFSLPTLGGSTDSIIRNMDKLLARMKSFSANITKLSSMGLDPKLLQQVINAGPIAGAKLAANLVAGGAGALSTINRGFADIGAVAGEIGMTGTQAQFGTQAQQTIYNVNINGGLDSSASIGRAVVDAVRAYERTSGAVWQGA